jgi:hypothetical protein
VVQQIAEAAEAAAAALKASVAHDDSAPACNAVPYAPDTTMPQHEDMVSPPQLHNQRQSHMGDTFVAST